MDKAATTEKYYFQVVKSGAKPAWPRPEEDLIVGQKDIPGGLTQFWAYPKDLAKEPDDPPPAEVLASENPTPKVAVLVDQPHTPLSVDDACLELVLVRDGHALARTASSVADLEENISAILSEGQKKFGVEAEHFMTTDRVTEDVEKKLDSLEEAETADQPTTTAVPPTIGSQTQSPPEVDEHQEPELPEPKPDPDETAEPAPSPSVPPPPIDFNTLSKSSAPEVEPASVIRPVGAQIPSSGIYASTRSSRSPSLLTSKLKWLVIILIVLGLFISAFIFRDKILSKVQLFGGGEGSQTSESTPTPVPSEAPTPTPAPSVERKDFSVRVLNGTAKTGAASSLGDELKNLGWEIDRVGNNPDQEVKKGYVRSKADTDKAATEVLLLDLGQGFEATASALKDNDTADLEVVIGAE